MISAVVNRLIIHQNRQLFSIKAFPFFIFQGILLKIIINLQQIRYLLYYCSSTNIQQIIRNLPTNLSKGNLFKFCLKRELQQFYEMQQQLRYYYPIFQSIQIMAFGIKASLFLPLLILIQLVFQIYCQTQVQPTASAPPIPTHVRTQVPLKYFIFSEQCFHTFFTEFNFFDTQCIKFTVSKLLGYLIIIGAMIVKVPQIVKIIQKGTTLGVSFQAVVLEQITQISALAYNVYRQNPFTIYGETMFITFQMMVIHLLFVFYDKQSRVKALLLFPPIAAFFFAGYFPEYGLFPEYILQNTMLFQMFVFAASRLSQIYQIHKIKSTGSVSIITYGLAVIGNSARVFTVLVEVKDDYLQVASFVLAFLLNLYICLCFIIFKEKKEEKGAKDKKKEV